MENPDPKKPLEVKPYLEPTLVEYGSVQQLTRSTGQSGNPDGAGAPRPKTHL